MGLDDLSKENKKYSRFNIKALVILVSSLVLILFTREILDPIISSVFYNPDKFDTNKYQKQLFLDTSVFTELHYPGFITNGVNVEDLNYGKYRMSIYQWETFKGRDEIVTGEIVRGEIKNLSQNFFKSAPGNAFGDAILAEYKQDRKAYEDIIKELEILPSTSMVSAYIAFKEDKPLSEIESLIKEFKSIYFSWIPVRYGKKDIGVSHQLGFEPTGTGIIVEESTEDKKKYPYLELANVKDRNITGEIMGIHFKTLLKYMTDQKDYLETFNFGFGGEEFYVNALRYVEKNGVKTYGVVAHGSPKDILKLINKNKTSNIELDNVKVSRYSK
ncbi:anti sigma factor C-terminal domain-containing protein [Clostridium cylindrosporum]|uniref:Sigma factor regulator C-terminal domain-containing protein n=1 Tax=Clostridium cylindrosporum DSM 605 TaxID=1121307 RepID=A0A0J8D920_CLOCY|nr:anti sigma factor C-terminal domain-containing protein [Clostridium cylindrosporum]KMT22372.1 hypothetical protein CLCY_13c00070 [Clostridium cylindrosporum DSM 605]